LNPEISSGAITKEVEPKSSGGGTQIAHSLCPAASSFSPELESVSMLFLTLSGVGALGAVHEFGLVEEASSFFLKSEERR
jgi:hypothetical protein